MKIALISFYDSRRLDEYPATHSLGAMRLAAYVSARHPAWMVALRAFDERGFNAAEASAQLHAESFDVVGLPAYVWTLDRARSLAQGLATWPSDPLVVCGGPETRAMSRDGWPEGAIFVVGQGEEPLEQLCRRRTAQPTFSGKDLTDEVDLPVYSSTRDRIDAIRRAVPDRNVRSLPQGVHLFSPEFDRLTCGDPIDTDFTWYETARGCIYSCSFCGHNTLPFFATFDLDFVAQEIANMRAHGIRRIFLIDPILGGKAARGKDVLRTFKTLAPDIAISAYMRPEFLDEEFVELLVESNIHELLMGLQTTNPSVPKHVRGNNFEKIMRFVPSLARRGVPWRAELIVGLPGDDMAGLQESLRFTIEELQPWSVHAYHLTAIPETKLFDLLDRTDEDMWIKADGRLRVVSSSSYGEAELGEMLAYAGAATSLYSRLRETRGKRPTYRRIHGRIQRLVRDGRWNGARDTFARLNHTRGQQLWQALERSAGPFQRRTA